jgi:DNA excision repair protein ERCC-2
MEITKTLRLSVHDLVDFMLRSGDIDNRIFNKASMQMGTKLHQAYQSAQSGAFEAEKFLKHTYVVDEFAVTIEGYADGIREILNKVYIEEIKTTVADLDQFSNQHEAWHTIASGLSMDICMRLTTIWIPSGFASSTLTKLTKKQ